MRSLGIRLGIIAVILGGGWLARDYISGNAGDLAVGDCFDVPRGNGSVVEEVQHHKCTDLHDAEVIFVGDFTPATDTYPSEAELTDFETDNCLPAFNAYTGLDFTTDELYGIGTLEPTTDGWKSGDHEVTCYVGRIDKTQLSTSIKKG